jgi:outer membrane lipoprotein-sorting protein
MKRIIIPILLCALLLAACGKNRGESDFRAFSERLNKLDTLSFTAQVRAEYEHKTARFGLAYEENGSGGRITVLAPELIRGVSARVMPGSSTLEYDSVVLDTGSLDSFGLTPLSSLPAMLRAMRLGHVDSVWEEDGKTVVMLEPDDDLRCSVWFSKGDMRPLRAELITDGRVTVFVDIGDWTEGAPVQAAPSE